MPGMRRALWICVGSWAAPATAQDFVPVAAASPPAAVVALGPDTRLEVADGVMWCVARGGRRPVGCTAPDGAGVVHAMTRAPTGTVFVAAENGWFALDAEHPVLDPMDLRDGVPPGVPRGIAADASGRLWVCTEATFGVLAPQYGFGRTFTEADGLPAAPFAGVAVDGGRVLLTTRDGTFAYTPDVGPAPRRVDDGPRHTSVTAGADGEVVVALRTEGRGGVTLRQRRRHDHQLRAMDGAVLRGLRPGRHVVEVHAIDRDLRREVVAIHDVHVPLPPQFGTRLLPLFAVGAWLVLFVFAFCRARPGLPPLRRAARAAGSAALVSVCGLQLLAACAGYGRSWPFVGFTMYTENWQPQSVIYKPRLEGLLADGARVSGAEHELGLLQDGYWQMLSEVAFGGPDAHAELLRRWNARRAGPLPRLVGFRLLDGRIRLTPRGPVDVAPTVVVSYVAP